LRNVDFRALSIYIHFLSMALERERYRRRAMARLIEIKGLGDTIAATTRAIGDVKARAASVNITAGMLGAELADLNEQLQQHRDDLRFHADTLGNSDKKENG